VSSALDARGHRLALLEAMGELEPRDPETGRLHPSPAVALHLAIATARFGRRAFAHRWNTAFAFDHHALRVGAALRALDRAPDVVLQNGALFAPGIPAPYPYALLLDHTRALAMASRPWPAFGVAPPVDYGRGWRAREVALYRRARLLAVFSENVARSLARDYRVDPARVRVVGAGANVFPQTAPRLDDGRTILFVGNEFARKGGPVLLDAFVRVRRVFPGTRLLIAGAREVPPLPEGAFHLGPVPLSELAALLAQTTVFALPTLQEPFGLAYLDAMACGVPCIGTRVEAVPEIVTDGVTGLLVPPGDPAALAEALEALLRDPLRARSMGARGRARVAARFRWSHVAERLEAALAHVLAPTERAAAGAV
jgi:glycosyltransferase involved in cell wall biosynthesis